MVIIGYVFSYLVPSKQKSVVFPIQSTQAFFIAQSGVEFSVRYATDQGWSTPAQLAGLTGRTRNLGAGRFTLTYTNSAPYLDTLTSIGEVPTGTVRRSIRVSNFSQFVAFTPLIIDPNSPAPCLTRNCVFGICLQHELYFYITNVGSSNIALDSFRATWDTDPPTINRIRFNNASRFNGSYTNGDPRTNFNANYTINPGDVIEVRIRWGLALGTCDFSNLVVYFYDTNNNMHTFILDPEGDGIPDC
jgi:hypothetical protein